MGQLRCNGWAKFRQVGQLRRNGWEACTTCQFTQVLCPEYLELTGSSREASRFGSDTMTRKLYRCPIGHTQVLQPLGPAVRLLPESNHRGACPENSLQFSKRRKTGSMQPVHYL